MNKTTIRVFLILLIVIVIVVAVNPLTSLRRSNETIRESVLEVTPVGTSMEDVTRTIKGKIGWRLQAVHYDRGYQVIGGRPSFYHPEYSVGNRSAVVGTKSMRAFIGTYYSPWHTTVEVYWGFDEDGRLIDIAVTKYMDAF